MFKSCMLSYADDILLFSNSPEELQAGLDLAWPTVVQLVVSFNSGLQWGISQEYSFFVSSQWLIWFCVFAEMHWLS